MEGKQSRKRLRPWLEYHANANTFKGLKWLNKEEKIFIISWKHQSNRTWDLSDAELFKAWALYTGKFKEGDPENPPEWKTRLRTALTKLSDIQEIKELHNLSPDQENPYKAYQFLDETAVGRSKCQSQPSPSSESGYSDSCSTSFQTSPASQIDLWELSDFEMDDKGNVDQPGAMNDMNNIPTVVLDKVKHHAMDHLNIGELKPSNVHSSNIYGSPRDQESQVTSSPSNLQFARIHHDNDYDNNTSHQQQQALPQDLEGIDGNGLVDLDPRITPNNMSLGSSLPSFESVPTMSSLTHHALEVQVYILGKCVYQEAFDVARLFCGDLSLQVQASEYDSHGQIFGSMNLKQIVIPGIDEISDLPPINDKSKKLIRDIQSNMGRGILVGGNSDGIYALRLCKARVSIWTQMRTVEKLNRDNLETQVFDMALFRKQLSDCCQKNVCQPSPSVTFIIGQQYKGDLLEMSHVLFCIKVTNLEAKRNLQQAIDHVSYATEDFASKSNPEDALADLLKQKMTFSS